MSAVEHANITLRVTKNLLEAARELARLAHIEPKTFLMEVLEAELALRRLQDLERLERLGFPQTPPTP